MEISYRETKKEDFFELAKLFKIAFGKEISVDYFEWKYKNGYSLVAELDGEIIGHYGGVFFDFIYKNKIFKIVQATDLMTYPSVRHLIGKKSVLISLANLFFEFCLKNNISFAYGFPGEKSRLLGEKFLNYKPLCKVKFWYFALNEENIIYPVENFQFINYDLKRIVNFKKNNGTKKDIFYLKWRYIENPTENYFISTNEDCFIVLKFMGKEVLIMDCIYKSEKSAIELFKGIKTSLKNANFEYLKTFPLNFLEREKFETKEENYFFEFKPLKINPEYFLKFEYFKPSDSDLF